MGPVRVKRLIIYEGTQQFVDHCLENRGVRGSITIMDGRITETFLPTAYNLFTLQRVKLFAHGITWTLQLVIIGLLLFR